MYLLYSSFRLKMRDRHADRLHKSFLSSSPPFLWTSSYQEWGKGWSCEWRLRAERWGQDQEAEKGRGRAEKGDQKARGKIGGIERM